MLSFFAIVPNVTRRSRMALPTSPHCGQCVVLEAHGFAESEMTARSERVRLLALTAERTDVCLRVNLGTARACPMRPTASRLRHWALRYSKSERAGQAEPAAQAAQEEHALRASKADRAERANRADQADEADQAAQEEHALRASKAERADRAGTMSASAVSCGALARFSKTRRQLRCHVSAVCRSKIMPCSSSLTASRSSSTSTITSTSRPCGPCGALRALRQLDKGAVVGEKAVDPTVIRLILLPRRHFSFFFFVFFFFIFFKKMGLSRLLGRKGGQSPKSLFSGPFSFEMPFCFLGPFRPFQSAGSRRRERASP
jgi:hypothetical protein